MATRLSLSCSPSLGRRQRDAQRRRRFRKRRHGPASFSANTAPTAARFVPHPRNGENKHTAKNITASTLREICFSHHRKYIVTARPGSKSSARRCRRGRELRATADREGLTPAAHPLTPRHLAALLVLLLQPFGARGAMVDLTLYGGAYDSSSTIAYAEVVQTCFGGLEVGSCEASSPNWLTDYLDQYNQGTTGAYCAACCSNTDVSGDTWTFSCPLASTAFADFVNHFGWEFRFGRGELDDDTGVVTCHIPRTACTYEEDGALATPCQSDTSYLAGYELTIEVMTIELGLRSWKSVQGCSVKSTESATQPEVLSETIIMTQVYSSGSGIEAGWAMLIALVAFSVLSCGVRYARDDRCAICGHHLIWFSRVCLPCRFFGYVPPSKDVAEIIEDKRSVVLPEPTLSERIGTAKATTTKVFVQATGGMIPTRTLSKISAIRNGTRNFGTAKAEEKAEQAGSGLSTGGKGPSSDGGVPGLQVSTVKSQGRLRRVPSARSVTFVSDMESEGPLKGAMSGKFTFRRGKRASQVVAAPVVAGSGSS